MSHGRSQNAQPSETSPLLRSLGVPSNNIASTAATPQPHNAHNEGHLERQPTSDSASKHHGMPEMRARMNYIFFAISIGVRLITPPFQRIYPIPRLTTSLQVFLAAADQTLVVSTYGTIGTELHALSSSSWIATAYFLTLTAFQPLYGKLSDIFGRKQCLLVAYFVFGLGAMLCGLARTMGEMVAARAFAGMGGGGMTVCTSVLMSDLLGLRERGTWQGYINIVYAGGAAMGAPLGGLLADSIGWRWGFLVQGPVCVLAMVAVAVVLRVPPQEQRHWKEKILQVDFLGAGVLITAVFGLLLGLDRGSNVSWSHPVTIAGLCMTPLFVAFVLVEKYVASNPFAPGRIIFNKSLFACYLCNFFAFGGWIAALFFLPLHWQVIGNYSPSQAGMLLVPSIVFGVGGSLCGGIYMKRTAKYYWITVIAYANLTFGMTLIMLFTGTARKSIPVMVAGSCICSFANGLGVTTTLIGLCTLSPVPPY